MKKLATLLPVLLAACGFSSVDNELTGQAKRVKKKTPIICGDYTEVDISLGVMRNGVGSMSTEDVWLLVNDSEQIKLLEKAVTDGAIVKVTYDIKRLTLCVPDHVLRTVEVLQDPLKSAEAQ
jgi:major membrane immunogen (membrane-anchored lipoprotein)